MVPRTSVVDLERAEALHLRAAEAPRQVVIDGRELLARPRLAAEVRSVAHRAVALALRGLDRPQEAVHEARRSASVARRAGLTDREADARLTLSLCLFHCGRGRSAVEQIERARELARGTTALLVAAQHGILLARVGRLEEAQARYAEALTGSLPPLDRVRVLNNRAIAFAFAGRSAEAVADLERAIELARAEAADLVVAELVHNLGFALAVDGDLPGALRRFDEADVAFVEAGVPIGLNLLARARALLSSNLYREARTAARGAVAALASGGAAADVAEARVLLATAELEDGDTQQAVATATLARRALVRQGRPGLAALADHVIVRARAAGRRRDRRLVDRAVSCADALGSAGFVAEELDARLTAALVARQLGRPTVARAHLDAVRAHRDRGPLLDRTRGWHAEVIHRLDAGDPAGARRAVEAGLDAVAALQSSMGGTELQVGVAGHGEALARLGLRLSVEAGDPWSVLRLLDRRRSASIGLRRLAEASSASPAAPSGVAEGELDEELATLRAALARLDQVVGEGEDPAAARRAIAIAEMRVRAWARHLAGAGPGPYRRGSLAELRSRLQGVSLLAYFELDGRLGGVTVRDGRAVLHRELALGAAEADALISSALFALRRLARPSTTAGSREAASRSLDHALRTLDAALVAPFVGAPDDDAAPLVVSPTGALHALPWSGLPSCRGRPVSVVSALSTLAPVAPVAGPTARPGPPAVALVAGPRLEGALTELSALASLYPSARRFGAGDSRVADVLATLGDVEVAHLACHGRFRTDNPMFSNLELADGPLTVFDLERLRRPPTVVVLAACDVGATAVSAGDELLGVTSALHRAGTRQVVASLVPVSDAAVVELMVELHRGLLAGARPAEALARAGTALGDGVGSLALRASFTSFGPP
jgi:tetratricopeptide (TPR) repeat protein